MAEDIEQRKKLSFEQAEGIEPLPSQLKLREVSPKLRAVLWNRIHSYLDDATEHSAYGTSYIQKPWSTILKAEHVYRQHGMADDFESNPGKLIKICGSTQAALQWRHARSRAPDEDHPRRNARRWRSQ